MHELTSNDSSSHLTLIQNLKKLGIDKNALFARVSYNDQSLHSLSKISDPDSIIQENDEQQEFDPQAQISDMIMLNEPLLGDCEIQTLGFEDQESQMAFWHSSAHILGSAIEQVYEEPQLTIGPSVKDGFFYDFYSPSGEVVKSEEDYKNLEKAIKNIIGKNYQFERLYLNKEQALDLFQYNQFKTEIIEKKVQEDQITSVFKIGEFIDLCTGPHIPSTKYAQAFKITKNSQAYWLGNSENESLQRVYGISFPKKEQLSDFLKIQEESKKRDHRIVGPKQELFFFSEHAPGSPFFLPHGTKIHNKLTEFLRNEYRQRGYQEVITPNMSNIDLWKISGHYTNYKDDLYLMKNQHGDKIETQGLKPMNCPGHCLIFKQKTYSYRDLPIRMADFGVLHRNELSGALSGLTRVRRFQQDDAHIFCMTEQIQSEIEDCLDFLNKVYGLFGFEYELFLSTRPEMYLGSQETWDEAESQLKKALDNFGKGWKLNKGDGAFYGPKIDIMIHDVLGRPQQCGTIQLDYSLPLRFDLQYSSQNKEDPEDAQERKILKKFLSEITYPPDEYSSEKFTWQEKPRKLNHERPVMVHRAILGSIERFMAILIEHLGGRWPLWLSPRQIKICSLSQKHVQYCQQIHKILHQNGWEVELDITDSSLNKKVRNAQLMQFNYIIVVGDDECQSNTVDVRSREGQRLGKLSVCEFENKLKKEYPEHIPLPGKAYNLK